MKFFQELPWRDAAGVELVGAPAPLDLWQVTAGDRLATLAALALATLPPPVATPPAPLLLCAPVPAGRFDPRALLDVLCAKLGPAVAPPASRVFATGPLAFLDALDEAERLLSTRTAREVLLGGVDSLVDRDSFDALVRAGRIKTATNEGIIAGEGAAFLRLALADGRSLPPGTLACVAARSRAQEPRTRDATEPNTGEGLAAAGRAALKAAGVGARDIGSVVHAAAGDRFGQREVGLALARLRLRTMRRQRRSGRRPARWATSAPPTVRSRSRCPPSSWRRRSIRPARRWCWPPETTPGAARRCSPPKRT